MYKASGVAPLTRRHSNPAISRYSSVNRQVMLFKLSVMVYFWSISSCRLLIFFLRSWYIILELEPMPPLATTIPPPELPRTDILPCPPVMRILPPPAPRFPRPVLVAFSAVTSGRSRVLLSRSEEHTSELQSRENIVCRLLL